MKKIIIAFMSVILAVCICVPFAACGDTQEPQAERKRIIGIDSDRTYLKAKYYLADNRDLGYKTLFFEILSYDKIEKGELKGVNFEIATADQGQLTAAEFELRDQNSVDGVDYYRYYVDVVMSMRWVTYDVRINSVTLNISGQDYKLKTDIYFILNNYRPVFVKPDFYGYTAGDAEKGPHSILITTRYDMTLKSLKFQTEGFNILSYYVEVYDTDTVTKKKVTEELPVMLEKGKNYQIYIEAIPPQDCLYYNYDIEAVVEISGIEMPYNNIEHSESILFSGSALNALNAD